MRLAMREVERHATDAHDVSLQIDRTAHDCPKPGQQLLKGKRLAEIVVGATV